MEIDQIQPQPQPQPHPNPIPHPHHRKVELQSPLDLTYLRENIATAAKQKIDLHFPLNAATNNHTVNGEDAKRRKKEGVDGEDPMRARVASLVNQFLDRTFDFAGHSISINGNDLPSITSFSTLASDHLQATKTDRTTLATSEAQETEEKEGVHFSYEQYDPRLSSKLASLYAELERETLAVSQLRRTAPAAGAKAYGEALMRSITEEMERDYAKGTGEGDTELKLEPFTNGWREEVSEMYERGLSELVRLGGGGMNGGAGGEITSGSEAGERRGGSLTETVGKAQRARDVAMEFE